MKASIFSRTSQRRSKATEAFLALVRQRTWATRSVMSVTWRETTSPSHSGEAWAMASSLTLRRSMGAS
ncbi:hypothetical protein D3C87_2009380 [compost metagenome]